MLDDVGDGRDHHGTSFFNAQETAACSQHRLNIALARRHLLTPEVLQAIYEHTRGVPRRINILGDFQLAGGGADTQETMIGTRRIAPLIRDEV